MNARLSLIALLFACLLSGAHSSNAQSSLNLPLADDLPSQDSAPDTRELRVLSSTLAAEQIDRVVLNRLLQEIMDSPQATAAQLGVESAQLQDILTLLSNAHGFINDNDMANVQAMCKTWDSSALSGEARIDEALAAYARRAQFTRDFIAMYYNVVLGNIEAGLNDSALQKFRLYMEDRRRRMASAGAITSSVVSENARSGEESIRFHCRSN